MMTLSTERFEIPALGADPLAAQGGRVAVLLKSALLVFRCALHCALRALLASVSSLSLTVSNLSVL
jgi:hypothetical protein